MADSRKPWTEIPKRPIVDTNVLFDYLVCTFSSSLNQPDIASRLNCLRDPIQQKAVRWYLPLAKPITSSPEVIAEIHGLARSRRHFQRHLLGDFWKSAQMELLQLGLDEVLVKLADMETPLLSSLGPTDTSLLEIAKLPADFRRLVLTEDGELKGQCRKKEIGVLTVSEVLSLWQQYGTT